MSLPFFKTQAKRREQIVAIDLGGRVTKAVHLQFKNDQYSLLGFAVIDTPTCEIHEKTLLVGVLAEHLKTVARSFGERTKHVTLAIGVADAFVRHSELPPVPVSDMRQMLKFNSKNFLQQDLPDHVFDCSVIVPRQHARPSEAAKVSSSQKQKVLVGGAKRQTLDELETAARQAGLQAMQIVPGLIGTVNAFEIAEPEIFSRDVVALVEIGFKNTTIVMLQNGEMIMNRVVAIGGDRFTAGLAESMAISYAEAEGIKVGMPGEVQQSLEPLVTALGRELRASIDFFEHQQDVTVSQVFVSGGTARGELIVQGLQSELLAPCKVWNPAKALQLSLSPKQRSEIEQAAPQLTVALGAAVASL